MKNPKVIFIVGYCGSGKTYLTKKFSKKGFYVFDENFLNSKEQKNRLIENLRHNINCVVVEIAYCIPERRTKILSKLAKELPGITIEWIFFENNLSVANHNCWFRRNKGHSRKHINLNQRLASSYEIPLWAKVIKIHKLK